MTEKQTKEKGKVTDDFWEMEDLLTSSGDCGKCHQGSHGIPGFNLPRDSCSQFPLAIRHTDNLRHLQDHKVSKADDLRLNGYKGKYAESWKGN